MSRGGDGLIDLGKDRAGKRWWRARLFWTDPLTSEARETKRKVQAPSRAVALQKRDALIEQMRTRGTRSERRRFRDVAAEWVAAAECYSTGQTRSSQAKKLNEHFGDWWIDAITARHVSDYLDGLTMSSANNIRNAAIGVFRVAVQKHYIDVNVAKLTERVRPKVAADTEDSDEPVRALTPEQLAAYLDDMEKHAPELYPMIHTQFVLGCRFSEVTALRRDNVDLDSGLVQLRRGQVRGNLGRTTKGKRSRRAALPLEARVVLKAHLARMAQEQPRGWDELCFPRPETGRPRPNNYWPSTTVWEAVHDSFERVGIAVKGKTHVARHTMITIAEGITPSEALLRAVVGHRSKKVHEGYMHPPDARVIHLGDVVGREMLKSRTGKKTGTPPR